MNLINANTAALADTCVYSVLLAVFSSLRIRPLATMNPTIMLKDLKTVSLVLRKVSQLSAAPPALKHARHTWPHRGLVLPGVTTAFIRSAAMQS